MTEIVTLSAVKANIRYWQPRLRLKQWEITASVQPVVAMDGNNAVINADEEHLTAHIRMAEDIDKSLEQVVVHELLHLPLAPFAPDKEKDELAHTLFEQTINIVAEALTA